jgi:hypothetical protein
MGFTASVDVDETQKTESTKNNSLVPKGD